MSIPVKTLAAMLNLSPRRVQQLANDNIIPRAEHGKYELVPCVRGYISYLQDRAIGREAGPIDSNIERGRLLRAQADKTELEVKVLKESLVTANEVEKIWCMILAAFRARMLVLPVKAAQMVISLKDFSEIELVLRSLIYEALTELAGYEPGRIIGTDHPLLENSSTATDTGSQ